MQPSQLNNITVAQLRLIARASKIKGRSKMNKADLIKAINNHIAGVVASPGGVPPLAPTVVKKSRKPAKKKSRKPAKKKSRKPAKKPAKKSRKQRVKKSRKPAKSRRSPEAKKSRKSHQKILADLYNSQVMNHGGSTLDVLSGPDLESQRKQIYNEIAQRVHSNPDLENFRDILPKNGNFDILEYIGIPYDVMFYLQQTFQKSPEQIKDLATAVVHTLLEIIHAQEEALKDALTKKLKQAEIVRHNTPDNFTDMLLGKNDGDIDQWNSLGYTQIERNKTTNKNFSKNRRDTSIKKGHWSMKSTDKKTPENLLEMSNFTVKGDPDEVMMFHGSREQFMKSLRNAIDWRKGGGYLGNGFYLTFNPNEAKMYACSTVLWGSSGRDDAVILETTIKNAKTLKRRGDKSWYSGSGDFRRNYRTDGGQLGMGWHDQINGRDKLLQNLEIKRIHLVPIKNLIVHGDGSNPGRNGRYTVRDKRGWICGSSNKRPPAKKKSRKARAKKKTVARVKPGSYLATLLDVLRSKNGWVVYEPAPSPMAIGPSIYVVKALKRGIALGLIEKLQTPGEKRLYMGHSYRLAGVTTPPKKSSKKKSRKAQKTRKKKTVAEWRAECKKQGLVYDTRTKRCRKSKKKSRKMKYKMRMKKKSSKC